MPSNAEAPQTAVYARLDEPVPVVDAGLRAVDRGGSTGTDSGAKTASRGSLTPTIVPVSSPDVLFAEQQSGKRGAERPEFTAALAALRAGDTLVFWKSDRWDSRPRTC